MTEESSNDKPIVWMDDDGVAHYRASAMGSCTTALILVRQGFTAMAPPKALQDRFNEGHLHEPDIVRRANTEFGLEVFARDPATDHQWTVQIPVTETVVIDGHTDGKCLGRITDSDGFPIEDFSPSTFRVFEAKTMSAAAFKKWKSMTWAERWVAYPGYAKQMALYLLGMSLLDGVEYTDWVYAVKNKESGEMLVEPGTGYPHPIDLIKAHVLGIEAHVRQSLPIPETCDSSWGSYGCPVFYVGPCGQESRTTLDDRISEVVVELARSYQKAKETESAAKATKTKARDEIKEHLRDGGKYEADGWKVAFTKRASKGTTVTESVDMERLTADHPDLIAEYTTTEEVEQWSSERLTVTPPKDSRW